MSPNPEILERLRSAAYEKVKTNAKIDPLAHVKPKHRWLPGPLPVLALVLVLLGLTVGYAFKVASAEATTTSGTSKAGTVASGKGEGKANGKNTGNGTETSPGKVQTQGNAQLIIVHVTGKVNKPGIVKLPPGSRVYDAIDAAGGVQKDCDIGTLNLARPLQDGEQIAVGIASAQQEKTEGGGSKLININEADASALEDLDGVGPALAKRIVDYRKKNGRFKSLEDLQNVSGIGPNLLARIKTGATV